MIGSVALDPRRAEHPGHVRPGGGEAALGHLFLPEWWGPGLAGEACAAALDWFVGAPPGEPVVLCTRTGDDRAMRLAARPGSAAVERFEEHGTEQWFAARGPDAPST